MADLKVWAIYDRPVQYPDAYVLRLLKTEAGRSDIVPTDHILVNRDLEVLRDLMRRWGMRCIPPISLDPPHVMEMWL